MSDADFLLWFVLAVYYLGLCLVPGAIAQERGRKPGALFFLAFFASPLVAILYAMALPVGHRLPVEAVAPGAPDLPDGVAAAPRGKPKKEGPDLDAWRLAMEEGRLCGACGEILGWALLPGERCPKCEVRRKK